MPRHYTDEQKKLTLQRLIANEGDVVATSAETGVSESTLRLWRREHGILSPSLSLAQQQQQQQQKDSASPSLYSAEPPVGAERGLGGEVSTSLRDLQTQMLTDAHVLAQSIQSAIADAPLGQRVAALAQLIDRIIKLAAQLPGEASEPDEIIVRVARHVEKEEDDEEISGLQSAGFASNTAEGNE